MPSQTSLSVLCRVLYCSTPPESPPGLDVTCVGADFPVSHLVQCLINTGDTQGKLLRPMKGMEADWRFRNIKGRVLCLRLCPAQPDKPQTSPLHSEWEPATSRCPQLPAHFPGPPSLLSQSRVTVLPRAGGFRKLGSGAGDSAELARATSEQLAPAIPRTLARFLKLWGPARPSVPAPRAPGLHERGAGAARRSRELPPPRCGLHGRPARQRLPGGERFARGWGGGAGGGGKSKGRD